jgi:hypothetical protein
MQGTLTDVGMSPTLLVKPGRSVVYALTVADDESFIGCVELQVSRDLFTWDVVRALEGTAEAPLTGAVLSGQSEPNATPRTGWFRVAVTAIDEASDGLSYSAVVGADDQASWALPNGTVLVRAHEEGVSLMGGAFLNFGAVNGEGGYGIRDDGGTLKGKNASGAWVALLGGVWSRAGTVLSPTTAGDVLAADVYVHSPAALAGDLALTDASADYQLLDAGAANRNVTLWTPAAGRTPARILKNKGLANNLVVKNAGGDTLVTLAPSDLASVVWDGTAWVVL